MELRDYQQESVDSLLRDAKGSPGSSLLITLPTGTGKSVVIAAVAAEIAKRGGRVLVLHRSKELVVQNHERFCQYYPEGCDSSGAYCAALGMRNTRDQVIFASVQSVFKRGHEFGKIDLVFVDEAHQIPSTENSQYQQLLRDLRDSSPRLRLMGCTATPYRLDNGVIAGPGQLFTKMSYVAPMAKMFDDGYLTKPVTLPAKQVDMSGVRTLGGEYNKADMQSKFLGTGPDTSEILRTANGVDAKSVLVFASGVAHAELIHTQLEELGESARLVTGDTLPLMRATSIESFVDRKVRWLVNVDVLTTGFDAPCVDMIAIVRATQSPGLFMQMIGRGTRLYPGKDECHVLDYGGNIERFGPVDSSTYGEDFLKPPSTGDGEAPTKVCPSCFTVTHASARECECGHTFPKREKVFKDTKESITVKPQIRSVVAEKHSRWKGKELDNGTKKTDTVKVDYRLNDDEGFQSRWAAEWLCVEHEGYAREKFERWWTDRSWTDPPETIEETLRLIDAGALAKTLTVTLRPEGKYVRITKATVGSKPAVERKTIEEIYEDEDDNIPF